MSTENAPGVSMAGTLYIVATPIGNLDDISARAIKILASVDVIAAEDTRHSGRLLQHLAIQKPMLALHDHNERDRAASLVDRLAKGESVALVSDAGTPLISDPGFVVVRDARARGFRVSPVPGPCAMVAALSAAGLPTDRFLFQGFLAAKRGARRAALEGLARETATLVFYESPHRISDFLDDVVDVLGAGREVVVARELTKSFETFYSGSASDVRQQVGEDSHGTRGEFVVMVRGADLTANAPDAVDVDRMLAMLVAELPVKKVARLVAELTGLPKNELYQRALRLRED